MRYVCNLFVCLFVVGLGTFALGEKNMGKQAVEKKGSIPRLVSLGNKERMKLLEQLSQERVNVLAALVSQLDSANPKEVNISIAFLLGVNRMEQAASHLSRLITLEADIVEHSREPLWGRYPVVEALIRIGNPAIPEMIKNIEVSDDEKVRELSTRVIRYIDGPEIAKVRLEKAMKKQSDEVKKAKLQHALESIRQ